MMKKVSLSDFVNDAKDYVRIRQEVDFLYNDTNENYLNQ